MVRAVSLFLTVLTGFSGLVYEVTWQKSLAILLGSHSEATAAVLGIFLGGLAVGYSVFGRITAGLVERARRAGRSPRLLFAYGLVESTIGLYALAFPTLFAATQRFSLALPHTSQGVAFAIDVALTALLIGPPTVLMGGTIPVLTQALARSVEDSTRIHAFVYAFNTAGAFFGALAAGFWLIPWLGIGGVLFAMGAVNLGAGALFVGFGLVRGEPAGLGAPEVEAPRLEGFALYAGVALLLGFAMMTIQTVLIRLGGLALGSSHFTFSMVVAVFVLCIALGSFAVSAMRRIRPIHLCAAVWALAILLGGLYLLLGDASYYTHVLRVQWPSEPAAFYPFHFSAFALILIVLALPVGLSGATLPLLFHHLRDQVGELGHVAGRLYSWNTLGSLLGALLGGYALFLWLDLHSVYRVAVAAVISAAVLLTLRLVPERGAVAPALAGTLALGGLVALPAWSPERLSAGLFRSREAPAEDFAGADAFFRRRGGGLRIDFYDDDPTTSVAVKSTVREGRLVRSIYTNGKPDGSLGGDYATMGLLAQIPCLLARECRSAFVIGWGTGVTAGELAALDSMERVEVSEISSGVLRAAPLFDYGNQGASLNPGIETIRSDAYRALSRSDERFDVIVSEPSNPWVSGVEMLFSREFLSAARDRLAPGGVYAQWMHAYETDDATLELVVRTYASVFDRVSVWFTVGPDLLLLGFQDPQARPDLDAIAERMARPDVSAGLARSGVLGLPELLAHERIPIGVIRALDLEGEVHTLMHPRLSDLAARAFFVGGWATLPETAAAEPARVGDGNSLLARYLASRGGRLDDVAWAAVADELCTHPLSCATVAARWAIDVPDSARRDAFLDSVRRERPGYAAHLDAPRLALLGQMLQGEVPDGPIPPSSALAWSRIYSLYYSHAFPFRREALDAIWSRCRAPGDGCREARERVERHLGPIGPAA